MRDLSKNLFHFEIERNSKSVSNDSFFGNGWRVQKVDKNWSIFAIRTQQIQTESVVCRPVQNIRIRKYSHVS